MKTSIRTLLLLSLAPILSPQVNGAAYFTGSQGISDTGVVLLDNSWQTMTSYTGLVPNSALLGNRFYDAAYASTAAVGFTLSEAAEADGDDLWALWRTLAS